MNPRIFFTNIKICKAAAASLNMRSKNGREVSIIFREYARKMHARAVPSDPQLHPPQRRLRQVVRALLPVLVDDFRHRVGRRDPVDQHRRRARAHVPRRKEGRRGTHTESARRGEAIRARVNANGGAVHPSQEIPLRELSMYVGGVPPCGLVIAFIVLLVVRWSD
ncbi:hypothetical protein GGX14DRAFT_679002 [Mycena pura]|uniref:Uncharacterized protein n=1 Tax=Mycena pura TaxID=153505 RepID=A0AAD6Y506_9AGAR|nr:hypothetical protein GGX14DRAFT_679002 [Mycena pura]